jgi:hypothetical protein
MASHREKEREGRKKKRDSTDGGWRLSLSSFCFQSHHHSHTNVKTAIVTPIL